MRELLPTHYFLVTFTVPGKLRKVVRSNQQACSAALFAAARATLVELASNKKFVGTDRMGFFGVLHTWGRDFTSYNPHVHFVVPGGGICLQHVVPSRLQRIRYYGFLSQNSKLSIGYVRLCVWFYRGWCYWLAKQKQDQPPPTQPIICRKCGAEMELIAITNASGAVLWPRMNKKLGSGEHAKPYQDSS